MNRCGRCTGGSPAPAWRTATGPDGYEALSRSEIAYQLAELLATPTALDELPQRLKETLGRPVSEAEVLAWLTLGAAARNENRPLLRPVVHAFVRGISGAVVTFPAASATARNSGSPPRTNCARAARASATRTFR